MTKTNTFREHIQRVIIETCDLWDIWSEWLWDKNDQKKIMRKTNTKAKTMTMTKTNTFREHTQRAILETCDLWDIWSEWLWDMPWPKEYHDKDKYKDKDNDKYI